VTFFGFMYPGERFYSVLPKAVFVETGFDESEVGLSAFYNTLVLPGERLVDDDLFKKLTERNKEKKLEPWQGERSWSGILKERDFRHADLSSIDLRKADISRSKLYGADLSFASLEGAILDEVSAQGAAFTGASLNDATLVSASLQGANLSFASLQGATLFEASLQGASLLSASLQGASLRAASLQGASLDYASLQGSSLVGAKMHGASLDRAQLQGASLRGAKVWRTKNGSFSIWATDLDELDFSSALTAVEYAELLTQSLAGVPEPAISRVVKALVDLRPATKSLEVVFDWDRYLKVSGTEPTGVRVERLVEIACDSEGFPYVAKNIVEERLDKNFGDISNNLALPLIHQLLQGCPGTQGIDQKTKSRLQQLKKEYSSPIAKLPESEGGN
jgi:uncharacterized protein YjbI with pentapeptide repeats